MNMHNCLAIITGFLPQVNARCIVRVIKLLLHPHCLPCHEKWTYSHSNKSLKILIVKADDVAALSNPDIQSSTEVWGVKIKTVISSGFLLVTGRARSSIWVIRRPAGLLSSSPLDPTSCVPPPVFYVYRSTSTIIVVCKCAILSVQHKYEAELRRTN